MLPKIFKRAARVGIYMLVTIAIAYFVRILFFLSCHVPSESMKPTIRMGDYILVNKMIPGLRTRKTEKGVCRLKGFRQVRKNDIVLFSFPYHDTNSKGDGKLTLSSSLFYLKRCVAVAGDTFYVENSVYKVKGYNGVLGSMEEQHKLLNKPTEKIKRDVYECFPYDRAEYAWNIKQFGPLYIPKKGDTLNIDSKNVKLYGNIITYETGVTVVVKDSAVYLGNDLLQQYTFTKNYYFVAGDRAQESHDSRYWGLLPEDHIIGKAFFIWKSEDKKSKKLRWSRMFKIL
jgi:signal peptidase I